MGEWSQEKFRNLILPSSNKCAPFIYAPLEKRGYFRIVIKTNKNVFSTFESNKVSFQDFTADSRYKTLAYVDQESINFGPVTKTYRSLIESVLGRKELKDIGVAFVQEKSQSNPGAQLGFKDFKSDYSHSNIDYSGRVKDSIKVSAQKNTEKDEDNDKDDDNDDED